MAGTLCCQLEATLPRSPDQQATAIASHQNDEQCLFVILFEARKAYGTSAAAQYDIEL